MNWNESRCKFKLYWNEMNPDANSNYIQNEFNNIEELQMTHWIQRIRIIKQKILPLASSYVYSFLIRFDEHILRGDHISKLVQRRSLNQNSCETSIQQKRARKVNKTITFSFIVSWNLETTAITFTRRSSFSLVVTVDEDEDEQVQCDCCDLESLNLNLLFFILPVQLLSLHKSMRITITIFRKTQFKFR